MEGAKGKRPEEEDGARGSAAVDMEVDGNEIVSSDDEIDYSVKPEFYDPNLDDKDESWVHKQRRGATSDAVLSCPACFTTLCLDCQRHEIYVTQYRAMFVFNCKIKKDQTVQAVPEETQKSRKSKNHKKTGDSPKDAESDEVLWPVCCSVCSTEVGVFDQDEVYHFYHVLPSNS